MHRKHFPESRKILTLLEKTAPDVLFKLLRDQNVAVVFQFLSDDVLNKKRKKDKKITGDAEIVETMETGKSHDDGRMEI